MTFQAPRPSDLFPEGNAFEKFNTVVEALKAGGNDSLVKKSRGEIAFAPQVGIVKTEAGQQADLLKSMEAQGGVSADLVKEWQLGNPVATTASQLEGYTPYDVESVLMIVPKELLIRNSTTREKGVGQGKSYRRVTAVTNSGASGTANLSGFFTSTTNTVAVNGTTLNRPPLITYAGDSTFVPYYEFGYTDVVSYQQSFASQGFTDARALSQLALIWAHMLGEERAFLNGRHTLLGVVGAAGTAADDVTVTGSGLPAAITTAVYATFSTSYGESKAITLTGTPTTAAGDGIKITGLTSLPAGTLAINIYANYAGTYYKGTTSLTTGASPLTFATVAALPSTVADNGSFNALGYDGAITEFNNSALSGYTSALNAALTALTTFSTASESMYITQGANVDVIWTTGSIMATAWGLIQAGSSSNGYRVNVQTGDNGITAGGAVTGIVNPATGKVIDIMAHRYMPAGVAVLHSRTVPWADSGVTSCMKYSATVDLNLIDWPQIGMSYDSSSYSYGSLMFEAPVLSGCITNINS